MPEVQELKIAAIVSVSVKSLYCLFTGFAIHNKSAEVLETHGRQLCTRDVLLQCLKWYKLALVDCNCIHLVRT